jgi:8-oxo-dGTP diphosphatase
VGAVVRDRSRLLLVLRAHPPAAGTWSLPGGRREDGESDSQACAREVTEETGLTVDVGPLAGVVEIDAGTGITYVVRDYVCTVTGGTLSAGDDAAEVGWFTVQQAASLPTSSGLLAHLGAWGVLPQQG